MGMSSKKSTTDTTQNTVQTPNVPQWGVDSLKGLNDQIGAIAGTDPSTFVTPASALQQQAFTGAQNLGGWQDTAGQATALANQVGAAGPNLTGPTASAGLTTTGPAAHATAASVLDGGLSKYLNPELNNVVDTSLADFDQNAGETRARQAAAGAQAGAFGGSRWGLQEGETEGQLARARGTLDSGLRSAAFDKATGLASDDANRAQAASLANAGADNQTGQFNATAANQNATTNAAATNQGQQFNAGQQDASLNRDQGVAGLLGTLSNAVNSNQIADVNTQAAGGDTQRQIAQDTATAPISLAQTVSQLLAGNQLPLLTGQTVNSTGTKTTSESPSTFAQIGAGLNTAAKIAALFG